MSAAWYGYYGEHLVNIHTNLDLRGENFGHQFVAIPRIGEEIASSTIWRKFRDPLKLRVVNVTYRDGEVDIELHLTTFFKSVADFGGWYRELTGQSII